MAKKYLDDSGLSHLWAIIKSTFALISHTHTKSQITDFDHSHGEISKTGSISTNVDIATGDRLTIVDSSASNKLKGTSITFDTATSGTDKKALTQAGTWQTFLTASDVPEGASASSTLPKALGADSHPDGYVGTETSFARGDHVHPLSPVFTGATSYGGSDGTVGLVPAPSAPELDSDNEKYGRVLTARGNWGTLGIDAGASSGGYDIRLNISKSNPDGYDKTINTATIGLATANLNGVMSKTDKTKLDGIATGAQVNVLEGVQVNGTDLTITNKKVNVPVFTAPTTSANGSVGLVPAPATSTSGDPMTSRYLAGSGVWRQLPIGQASANALMYADGTVHRFAELDGNGLIPTSVLPSFVDDVIEAYVRSGQTELSSTWLATGSATGAVITPEAGKIYVLMNSSTNYDVNTQFRWGGSAYVKLNDGGVTAITNTEIDTICV